MRGSLAVREGIASAAVRLFLERGFVETTIDDIAFEAGISRRTYFRYFASKDEAILVFLDVVGVQMVTHFRARPPEETTLAAIRAAMRTVLSEVVEETPLGRALTRLIFETPSLRARALQQQAESMHTLADAIATRRGLAEPDLRAELVAAFAGSILDLATQKWLADDTHTLLHHLDRVFEAAREVRASPPAGAAQVGPPGADASPGGNPPEGPRG